MVYQQSRGVSALEHGRSVVSPDAEAKFGTLTGVHPFARDAEASSRLKVAHPQPGARSPSHRDTPHPASVSRAFVAHRFSGHGNEDVAAMFDRLARKAGAPAATAESGTSP